MTEREQAPEPVDDVDAVTQAVLTASRLLVAVSARSLATAEDRVTLPQFRLLVVLSTHGPAKLVALADRLGVNPSTAMRMMDRLIASGLADRQVNPANRRETVLRVTDDGARLVDEVTARRRAEIAAVVARMLPEQRTAMVEALTAFNQAGGEPKVTETERVLYPLGWTDGQAQETRS
ncbi:MarR family winged helix-turn-helix transcriptional regulator [Streptomyces sp. TS71-3]|uniref:MarR family winged helix-turn-helix transcriptional regulator n=1 Tax=Streptomyces sp. TS71-3 TaxID=2733862 RepID=UPI001B116A13|nr:MarR family transcriptional regulator [Streptomyces sp. TS71-3]GHJ38512.1 transcriptional regulator [Streptomyces sp. TS71-3]